MNETSHQMTNQNKDQSLRSFAKDHMRAQLNIYEYKRLNRISFTIFFCSGINRENMTKRNQMLHNLSWLE